MEEVLRHHGVVVVGGGVAGAAAATWLAESGSDVILLEKEQASHDKVCGEFISPAAQFYLGKLGWNPDEVAASAMRHFRLIRGTSILSQNLPFIARGLSRAILDESLLEKAVQAGATVRRGAKVTGLERIKGLWHIALSGGDKMQAANVFLATGKHELRGWHRETRRQSDFIGFKCHYHLCADQREALEDHIEVYLFNGGYAGLAPLGHGRANLCLVVSRERFKALGNSWENFLNWLISTTPLLHDRLAGASPDHPRPLAIYGLPYGYLYKAKRNEAQGLYRLGDQMAVIPSFSGDGMAIALYTAYQAAKSFTDSDNTSYHRRVRKELKPVIRRASILSFMMERSLTSYMGYTACRIVPGLTNSLIRNIRLPLPDLA